MIKKLRRRMILINMLLVGTVILAIFIAVIYNNYSNSVNMMERGMNQVLDKQGKQFGDRREPFPEELFGGENDLAAPDNGTQAATVGTGSQPQASAPAATPNEPSAEPAAPGENGQFKKDFHREFGDETPIEISSYVIAETNADGDILNSTENDLSIDREGAAKRQRLRSARRIRSDVRCAHLRLSQPSDLCEQQLRLHLAHQFDPHFAAAVCRQYGGHLRHQPDFV